MAMKVRLAMDWDDVKVFLAVARAGSLGGAARMLGQSQPTMGRRLKAFEARLGQSLFLRSNEGFVLTDEGMAVREHAERMEEEAFAFERRLAGQAAQLEGPIRASSSDWFGVYVLSPVFARFQQQHPRVTIELVTDTRLLDLARREADLVFRNQPFDEPDVVQRHLMSIHYRLYGRTDLPVPRAGDGAGCPLVTMDTAFDDLPDMQWLRRLLPRAHTATRSNNREVQAALCAAGSGWAVLPTAVGDKLAGCIAANLGEPPPQREMYMGYHRDMRRSARIRKLMEHVMAELSSTGAA